MDFAKMGALNDGITPEGVNYYLNKAGSIIRKSLPPGLKSVRWGGDEIMFYRDPKAATPIADSEVKHYMNKLKFALEKSTPFESRWVRGSTADEANNLIETAKKAEGGHKQLPADFDAQRWMKFKKTAGDPEAVAAGFDEAEAGPVAPRKRTKMNVRPKEDGSLEISTERRTFPRVPPARPKSPGRASSRRFAEEGVRTQEPFAPAERPVWNVGNIMDELADLYHDRGRSEIKDMARKAYVRGKRSGQWEWLDGKYRKAARNVAAHPAAAPPRPLTPVSQAPLPTPPWPGPRKPLLGPPERNPVGQSRAGSRG
ncbi:MAG: hypothetical protein MZV49_24340 [Rhodopseudomonas palustris]|nr:hypothetical protein [Rhodopseudomonas palustris]